MNSKTLDNKMDSKQYFYGLDYLRAIAMLLGIVLHGVFSFSTEGYWIVNEKNNSEYINIVIGFIHSFRMQFFFVLSGFFSILIIQRYQLNGFLKARVKRIVLPFLASIATVLPITLVLAVYFSSLDEPSVKAVGELQLYIQDAIRIRPWILQDIFSVEIFAHLWFLWYLCWIISIHYLFSWILIKLKNTSIIRSIGKFSFIQSSNHLFIVMKITGLIILTTYCHQFMNLSRPSLGADTSAGLVPVPYVFGYYLCLYLLGCALFHKTIIDSLQRIKPIIYWTMILSSIFILFPIVLYVYSTELNYEYTNYVTTLINSSIQSIYLIVFITALFAYGLSVKSSNAVFTYLSQSSYFVYIIHLPIVFFLQHISVQFDYPLVLKMTLVLLMTIIISFGMYHYLVRGKWVGYFLGERKV